jgi:hypothetical protein
MAGWLADTLVVMRAEWTAVSRVDTTVVRTAGPWEWRLAVGMAGHLVAR